MGKHFPVRQKSGNFFKNWKVKENHTGEFQKNVIFYNLVIFKMDPSFQFKKEYWKNEEKYWKSQEFYQSGKVGTMASQS